MQRIRVLLADDQVLMREALQLILEAEFEIVGTADNGEAAVMEAARLKPELVLLDISLPRVNGIEAARRIRATLPVVKTVILTQHTEKEYIEAALQSGVSGYCMKSSAASELLTALHGVMQGDLFVSPSIARMRYQ